MSDLVNVAPGQCRLQVDSTTQISLQRYQGSFLPLKISGTWEAKIVPSSGPTLANTGLTAATKYFIYAFDSSGTLTLEASTTAHATDADTGVEIKSGDASRTLVGMVYMGAGTPGTFVDSATQRFCLNWFNRIARGLVNGFTADRSTGNTSYVELNTEIRVEFLTWANEVVRVGASGGIRHSAQGIVDTSVGFDGTTAEDTMSSGQAFVATASFPFGLHLYKNGLSEGYHYATLLGLTNTGTATWSGGAVGAHGFPGGRCSLTAAVMG